MTYDATDHYWFVGTPHAGQVFSSKAAVYVDTADAAYAAWVEAGGVPSLIGSAGELAARLVKAGLPNATVAALSAGLSPTEALAVVQAIGLAIVSTGTPVLDGTYAIDGTAQQIIASVYAGIKGGDGLPGGGATFYHPDITGSPHAFTGAQFAAFAKAVRDYVYAIEMAAAAVNPVWPAATATIP